MKKQAGAAKILARRLKDHPDLPQATRHIMAALATDAAAPAWLFFGQDEAIVGRVVNRVRQAYEQAVHEIDRPKSKAELDDIKSIIEKAEALKLAIKTSSLPGNWARMNKFELSAEERPAVPLDVGWHSLRKDWQGMGYPLAVTDVLDWAVELANHHLDNLPVRAVERQKDQPKVTAFVRLLAWHFHREFKSEHRTAIGHITAAVFDLNEPLDLKQVEAKLKDRKPPFKPT
jgi:hypothetical protein